MFVRGMDNSGYTCGNSDRANTDEGEGHFFIITWADETRYFSDLNGLTDPIIIVSDKSKSAVCIKSHSALIVAKLQNNCLHLSNLSFRLYTGASAHNTDFGGRYFFKYSEIIGK